MEKVLELHVLDNTEEIQPSLRDCQGSLILGLPDTLRNNLCISNVYQLITNRGRLCCRALPSKEHWKLSLNTHGPVPGFEQPLPMLDLLYEHHPAAESFKHKSAFSPHFLLFIHPSWQQFWRYKLLTSARFYSLFFSAFNICGEGYKLFPVGFFLDFTSLQSLSALSFSPKHDKDHADVFGAEHSSLQHCSGCTSWPCRAGDDVWGVISVVNGHKQKGKWNQNFSRQRSWLSKPLV